MINRTITPEAKAALRALAVAHRRARELDDRIFTLATTALAGGMSFKQIGAAHTPPLTGPASRSRFEGGEAGRDHRRAQARLRSRQRNEVLAQVTQEDGSPRSAQTRHSGRNQEEIWKTISSAALIAALAIGALSG